MMSKNEKRSETIEVRIGYDAKRRFMDACQKSGVTASGVLRGSIGVFVSSIGAFHAFRSELTKRKLLLCTTILAAVSAVMFLAINPLSLDSTLSERKDVFNQIDIDRKGYFTVSEFYVFSGMTAQGKLSDQDRSATKAAYWSKIERYRDTITAERATPEFIESVIANSEMTAAKSLTDLFQEMDTDQDGMITAHEFLIIKDATI